MLPEPALTFTLPSLHDGLTLDCRLYHPLSLSPSPQAPTWKCHAAIIAHPYAPMGGSYDDPVVEIAAGRLLHQGFLVGTFNFRGAGNSAGRTSWTAKPERDDYTTFVGFMVHYIHYLDPYRSRETQHDLMRKPERPVLLMGGYSYGAMVTAQLRPLDAILQLFVSPESDSEAALVRLRAEQFAENQNQILGNACASLMLPTSPRSYSRMGVRVGGDEGGRSRKSHDGHGRRSLSIEAEERFRRRVNELIVKTRTSSHSHSRSASHSQNASNLAIPELDETNQRLSPIQGLIRPRPAYLLVSPLQGIITHLATMSLIPAAFGKPQEPYEEAAEEKLVRNPALAVYGDKDIFVSANKLREWTRRLKARHGSQFCGEEILTAGHFWIEDGVLLRMKDLVSKFADELIGSSASLSGGDAVDGVNHPNLS